MENILLSQIDAETLINRIAVKTAELIGVSNNSSTESDAESDLITPKEACNLLQITIVTLWRYQKKGRIKAYGLGGKRYFKRSEILDSLTQKK